MGHAEPGQPERGRAPSEAPDLSVEVVYSPAPEQVLRRPLSLPAGSTVADALQASGLALEGHAIQPLETGIWGLKAGPETRLREGDRVEIYRPLRCDPKEARRQRYRQRKSRLEGI
jgi:putative ubiquitin-RnfH superfamily antitoxin RatB of RatAB toxin-antitoxin module